MTVRWNYARNFYAQERTRNAFKLVPIRWENTSILDREEIKLGLQLVLVKHNTMMIAYVEKYCPQWL